MKTLRIEDVDMINFDYFKAELKTSFSTEAEYNVKDISTMKDSCFLNLLHEVWKNTPHREMVEKIRRFS